MSDIYLNKVFNLSNHNYFVVLKSANGNYLCLNFTTDYSGHTADVCYVELDEMKQILPPSKHLKLYKNKKEASYIKFSFAQSFKSCELDIFLGENPEVVPVTLNLNKRIENYLLKHATSPEFPLSKELAKEFYPEIWAKRKNNAE